MVHGGSLNHLLILLKDSGTQAMLVLVATQILVFWELLQIVHHEVAAVIWGECVSGSKAISIDLVQQFKRQEYFLRDRLSLMRQSVSSSASAFVRSCSHRQNLPEQRLADPGWTRKRDIEMLRHPLRVG